MLEMRNVIFFGLAISKEYLPNQLIALKERTEINKKKIVLIAKNVCFALLIAAFFGLHDEWKPT